MLSFKLHVIRDSYMSRLESCIPMIIKDLNNYLRLNLLKVNFTLGLMIDTRLFYEGKVSIFTFYYRFFVYIYFEDFQMYDNGKYFHRANFERKNTYINPFSIPF